MLILAHSAPSWILSSAENLASFSLQDGARIGTIIIGPASQPASQPPSNLLWFCAVSPPLSLNSLHRPHPSVNIWTHFLVRCPPLILSSMWCYVRCPHPSKNIWTQFLVQCLPWFWIVCCVPTYSYVRCPPHPYIYPRIISCLPTQAITVDMIPMSI